MVLWAALGLGAAGAAIWGGLRIAHARQFTGRGWTFERNPGEQPVFGLNHPPFGRDLGRRVGEVVRGTVEGVAFTAVAYETDRERVTGYAVIVALPRSLPPLVVGSPDALPSRLAGAPVPAPAGRAAWASDPAWASVALPILAPTLAALTAERGAALSVDGAALVGLGCPRDADALAAFVPQLGRAAAALVEATPGAAGGGGFTGPPVPRELSFTDHPSWIYRARDDAKLAAVRATGGGFDHEAHDVVIAPDPELGAIALRHTWRTRRTVTETGPDGKMQTRTVVDDHEEHLCELVLGFPFVDLTVNTRGDWGRGRVRFESEDFNREFTVRCADGRFASAVFHPRQMEYLQRRRPAAFQVIGDRFEVEHDGDVATVEAWLSFARGFFGRVPGFVWKDLGVEPPRSCSGGWPEPARPGTMGA